MVSSVNVAACASLLRKVAKNRARQCRDLDADIYEAFGFDVVRDQRWQHGISWRFKDGSRWVSMRRVSTDERDTFSFIERVMPSAMPILLRLSNGKWIAAIDEIPSAPFALSFTNRPQALVVALLRAVSTRDLNESEAAS